MPLPDDLLRPAAYPHSVQSVDLAQTHISWVFLTGEFAFKVKKPVKLSFLDFSTKELRRKCCDEELRTNRRLAPHLYLDVVPITVGAEGFLLMNGPGEAVDWAVKMRQFPESALLSHKLASGELLPRHIDALAREVAEFHSRAAIAEESSRFGRSETVVAPVLECFDHVTSPENSTDESERINRLRAWVEREHARLSGVFDERRRTGSVRECHGDMHLGNLLVEPSTPPDSTGLSMPEQVTAFDGIEFNEAFRWIDVLSEVAFTMMDLTDRGRPDFAWRYLNAYLEQTGDYAGVRVLRFYLVYRALVRAKVAGIRLKQPGLSAEERREQQSEVNSYLHLAMEYSHPAPPRLVLTHGPSGSGKSTWTQPLLEQMPAIRLRSDVERKRSVQLPATSSEKTLYAPERISQTYEHLAELTTVVLNAGLNVLVDATFLKRAHRDRFRKLAQEHGVSLVILDFQCPEAELRRRIERRAVHGGDPSDATVEVLDGQLRSRDPLEQDESSSVFAIDTTDPVSQSRIDEILERIALDTR